MIHFPLQNIRKSIDGQWEQIYYTETRTIPGSADNYIIDLIEVPDDGTVNQKPVIQNFTETNIYPPPSGSYYVNYGTGYIGFNSADEGKDVTIEYHAKGSLVEADDINYLYNLIKKNKKQVDKFIVDQFIVDNKYVYLTYVPNTDEHIDVYMNGLLLDEGWDSDYILSDNFLTFAPNLSLTIDDKIIVKYKYMDD
jgi:hypothetical protein